MPSAQTRVGTAPDSGFWVGAWCVTRMLCTTPDMGRDLGKLDERRLCKAQLGSVIASARSFGDARLMTIVHPELRSQPTRPTESATDEEPSRGADDGLHP